MSQEAETEQLDDFTDDELRALARLCTAARRIQDARGRIVLLDLALDDKRDTLANLKREETRALYQQEIDELEAARASQLDELQAVEAVHAARLAEVEKFAQADTVKLVNGHPTAKRKSEEKGP